MHIETHMKTPVAMTTCLQAEIDENNVQTGAVFHAYINPERDMPEEVIKVHGLDNEFLKTYPTFEFYKNAFLHH